MPSSSSSSSPSSDEDVKVTGVEKSDKGGVARRRREAPDSKKSERVAAPPAKQTKKGSALIKLPGFMTDPGNPIGWAVSGTQDFAADSIRLVRRCTKPDFREFKKIAYACALGFLLMGFVGFIVKLVFIPINNIIVGG